MPEIVLTNITKRWDKFYAVDNLSMVIDDNAFVTLLGPSGCGKTTTLRMIAGLETPTSGRITIGGVPVFDSEKGIDVPPNKRNVGFLFQNYALWPNMTVYQNIAFGLGNIKEEMPLVDTEAARLNGLVNALSKPKDILTAITEATDKDGKIDNDLALIRLIDTFEISMKSAKQLLGMKIPEASDPAAVAASQAAPLQSRLDALIKSHTGNGETLNEEFQILKDGQARTAVRKLDSEEVDLAVRYVSRIVKIGMFMGRYPSELSGGQQQRVAIARTLAPRPGVLFMDEPLSNLDAKLRLEMRSELQRLHIGTGSTFIYVTHDQMEAMTLATKICLMDNGVLQQYDAPLDVYNRPANLFVADFVGNPAINFIEAQGTQRPDGTLPLRVFDDLDVVFTPNEPVDLAAWHRAADAQDAERESQARQRAAQKGAVEKSNKDSTFQYRIQKVAETELGDDPVITDDDFVLGVRPEFIELHPNGAVEAVVYSSMPTGMETTVQLEIGDYLITGVMFGGVRYQIGQQVHVDVEGTQVMLFSRKNHRLIAEGSLKVAG
jgi:ABC-type sugar transport system ATPase subunit